MTMTLKSKETQMSVMKATQSRQVRHPACAVESRRELAGSDGFASRERPTITAAERRVLALLAQAKSNKEIAINLGISAATVKRHMEKILTKLGLRNRVQAAIYGLTLQGCPYESNANCGFRQLQSLDSDKF